MMEFLVLGLVAICAVVFLSWYTVLGVNLRRHEACSDMPLWRAPQIQMAVWGILSIFGSVAVYKMHSHYPSAEMALYYVGMSFLLTIMLATLGAMISSRATTQWIANGCSSSPRCLARVRASS